MLDISLWLVYIWNANVTMTNTETDTALKNRASQAPASAPTLKEVALKAGVSVSTTSRVISEPEKVKKETRDRVQKVIDELGYHPSRVARRLRAKNVQSHILGLVVPDIQNPFFADVARGVEDFTQAKGYAVILFNSDEDPGKEQFSLNVLRGENVDGAIIAPLGESDAVIDELLRIGIPVVAIDRALKRQVVDTVTVDNIRGAFDAVQLLIELGHKRIGFIEGLPALSTSKERLEGYRKALSDNGITLDTALERIGDSRQASGRRLAEELLSLPDRPTALFVGNNLMTLGALEAIHTNKLRIPEDIAIVGYDDIPWALALNPPLSMVRQPAYQVGRFAAELMLQRIQDPKRDTVAITLHPNLIVRGFDPQSIPSTKDKPDK